MDDIEVKRGPGRPPKYVEVEKTEESALVGQSIGARQRPKRRPFGSLEQKLAYPERPNFHRHWFNDAKNRIDRALEAGYEHVKDKEGKNVSYVVGTAEAGGPLHAFLMEIPQEWYDEDMAAQQKERDERMSAIKRGDANRQEGDGRYVPAQGISITHGK